MANKKYLSVTTTLFFFLIALNIFSRSMFNIGSWFSYVNILLTLVMFIFSFFEFTFTKKDIIWLISGICIATFTYSLSCVLTILIMFSLRKINLKRSIKVIIFTIIISLLIIYFSSKLGIISNISFYRINNLRSSFGMQFPLVFSAYVFYLCVYLTIAYKKKNPIKVTIILLITFFLLSQVVDAINDEYCIALLILSIWFNKLKWSVKSKKTFINTVTVLVLVLIIFSIFISQIIPYSSNIFTDLNNLFSGRLNLQYKLFQNYRPHLTGQYIFQMGYGGQLLNVINYFYIDNSFVRFLFMDGILFFIFILWTFLRQIFVLINTSQYVYALILLIILINGISSDTLSQLTQSIIILPLFYVSQSIFAEI